MKKYTLSMRTSPDRQRRPHLSQPLYECRQGLSKAVRPISLRLIILLSTVMVLAGGPPQAFALTCPARIIKEKSLLISELSVVEDPVRTVWTGSTNTASDGAWSFGRLMANMAGPHNPSDFVRNWLQNWETDRTINTFSVGARPTSDQWLSIPGRSFSMAGLI
jgi:hypothetical protein